MSDRLNKLTSQRLNEVLKENNMMQKQLSADLHISVQHMSHLCTGQARLTPEIADRLTQIFPGIRKDYFLGRDNYKTTKELLYGQFQELVNTTEATKAVFNGLCALCEKDIKPVESEKAFQVPGTDETIRLIDTMVSGVVFTQGDIAAFIDKILPHVEIELNALIMHKKMVQAK